MPRSEKSAVSEGESITQVVSGETGTTHGPLVFGSDSNGLARALKLTPSGLLDFSGTTIGVSAASNLPVAIQGTPTMNVGTMPQVGVSAASAFPVSASSDFPVSQSGTWGVNLTSGSATIGAVIISGTTTSLIPITGTVGISGTASVVGTVAITGTAQVAGNVSLTTGSATIGAVLISATATSSIPINDGGNLITVDGTVGAAQAGVWSVSSVQQGTWNVNLTSSSATIGAVIISGTTTSLIPITGTVSISGTASVVGNVGLTSGSQTIGAVVISGTTTAAIPSSLQAGTNRAGGFYDIGKQIIDEVPTVRTVNYSFTNASALGNTQVVAAQGAGVRIRLLSAMAVATLPVSLKFQSNATDVSATFPVGANGGFVLPMNHHGWFQTGANEPLNFNLNTGTAVGVNVVWVQAT